MKHNLLKYVICVNLVVFILAFGCNQYEIKESGVIISDSLYLKNLPPQPGEESWQFIENHNGSIPAGVSITSWGMNR